MGTGAASVPFNFGDVLDIKVLYNLIELTNTKWAKRAIQDFTHRVFIPTGKTRAPFFFPDLVDQGVNMARRLSPVTKWHFAVGAVFQVIAVAHASNCGLLALVLWLAGFFVDILLIDHKIKHFVHITLNVLFMQGVAHTAANIWVDTNGFGQVIVITLFVAVGFKVGVGLAKGSVGLWYRQATGYAVDG